MNAITYPGGKGAAGVAQTLINQIPPHAEYIAAFAGFDAIARTKRPADRSVLIDMDRDTLTNLAELLAATWCDQLGSLATMQRFELVHADGLAWLAYRFGLDRLTPAPPRPRVPGQAWQPCEAAGPFVYLDPPYPMETRSGRQLYRYEMTPEQHRQLLAIARALPCPVMVSSYASSSYCEQLADWRRLDFQAMTRGGVRTESVWMNYPEPARLHDATHVGDDKRERERIRRRVRNWVAGLGRVGLHERQAMLDAIAAEYFDDGG